MISHNELVDKLFSTKGFPDPLYPFKSTKEFGLQVAKAIENEWFRRHKNSDSRYYDNQYKYHRLRLYARAEQPIAKYKNELAINGDLSYLNLDWTPVPIAPKFVDIVVNGLSTRSFAIKAQAIDKVASEHKSKYMKEIRKDMIAKEGLMKAQQELGINGFTEPPESLPQNDEELQIRMQLNYKQGVEIAKEEAIEYVMRLNRFPDVKKRFDYDIMVIGKGAIKHSFNPSDGIKVEYVDPAYLVHSYTESPTKDDCYYYGEVKKIPLSEIRKINSSITNEELEKAKASSSDWDLYHRLKDQQRSEFDGHTANVLFFTYKTTREKVYKKKRLANGMVRVTRKPEGWNPDPMDMLERGYERMVKQEDVWYEGVLILGTDMLLQWKLCENMIREAATNNAIAPYIAVTPRIYDDRAESLLQRMIPFIDQIQLIHLKLQQVAARVVPDGVYIDADGLNEIDLGDGKRYSPREAMNLFFQTGSVIGRSYTSMGEFNHGRVPIQELQHNSGRAKIQALIEMYNMYLQMIRDATGLNEARDASTPDERALVGVQKLAALNSNTATRHIQDAGVYVTERIAEAVSLRISDLIKYSDTRDELIEAVGAANVSAMEDLMKLPLHRFGIFIEVEPDAEEKQYLEQNIQAAVAQGHIYLDDAEEIRRVRNTKLANRLLRLRREQKMKKEQEMKLQEHQAQSEAQTQTVQAKAEADMQLTQLKSKGKIEEIQMQYDMEDRNQEREKERKKELMEIEFQYNQEMKAMDADFNLEGKVIDAEAKERQIEKQAKTKAPSSAPPKKAFESEEDTLDGFGLEQFEPR